MPYAIMALSAVELLARIRPNHYFRHARLPSLLLIRFFAKNSFGADIVSATDAFRHRYAIMSS